MSKERFKITPAVYLMLLRENKILLARRYNTGFRDGEYSFPAGHLDGNETIVQATIREAKEEIGIILNPTDLKLIHMMHRKEPTEERMDFFFVSSSWEDEPRIMEPHKCDNLNWFELNNLPDNVIPYIKLAINCFTENRFYSEIGW